MGISDNIGKSYPPTPGTLEGDSFSFTKSASDSTGSRGTIDREEEDEFRTTGL